MGVRLDHTATDVENRLFCLTDELDGLLDLTGVRNGDRAVTRQVDLGWPDEVEFGVLDVLGDVHQNRSRAAGDGEVECLGQGLGDIVGVGDHEVVLGHRHGDATDIGFLEGVGTQETATDLTGDGNHWHRVQVRIGDRGDQVGGTGAGGGDTDTDAAGDLCITGCGMSRALLVAHEHMADPRGGIQRVVYGENRTARNAEHNVGIQFL